MNPSKPIVDNPEKKPGRKLIVFADGTGNAFTQQESNVWRLYQMLDRTAPDQKALYLQGVGTSGNKVLASLDSATGFGVPSNVRKLYRFLCWNWQEGDEIYMFGFSRGAFTIRCLVGLIASQGLMPQSVGGRPTSTADLEMNAMGAWRAYRSQTAPFEWANFFQDIKTTSPLVAITRHVRDLLVMGSRWLLRRPQHAEVLARLHREQPERTPEEKKVTIKFLGLFDTVEAYGLPVEELRGVVNWAIWPISFRNRICSPIVERIRHALSLDDERTTFHPIRFDQSRDPLKVPPRTREVWFSGVHSDVGGGYADDSLALIPFSWMVAEAREAGLRFDEEAVQRLTSKNSPLAPIHNSREGLASFYRYDPRRVTDDLKVDGGPPIIHHAVAEKIIFGTGGYAPIVLPKKVKVLAPDGRLEDIAGLGSPHIQTISRGSDHAAETALQTLQAKPPNPALLEQVRSLVLWRRIAYFLLVTITVVIALMPVLGSSFEAFLYFLMDNRSTEYADATIDTVATVGGEWAGMFLPGFLSPWIDALRNYSISMAICLVIWLLFYNFNATLHDRIRDSAYEAWVAHDGVPSPLPGPLRYLTAAGDALRLGPIWLRLHRFSSRYLAPTVFTLVLVLGIGIILSRSTMSVLTRSGSICKEAATARIVPPEEAQPLRPGRSVKLIGFSPKQFCWSTKVHLIKGQTYTIWIDPEETFVDQTIVTPPRGFLSNGWVHFLTQKTLRRHTDAAWLQPLAQIGIRADAVFPLVSADGRLTYESGYEPKEALGWNESWKDITDTAERAGFEAFRDKAVDSQHKDDAIRFVSRFVAPEDGPLYLYANDAVAALPIVGYLTWFYDNNEGTARVTIVRDPLPEAAQEQNI